MTRVRISDPPEPTIKRRKRNATEPAEVKFFSSGCTLLDRALGGGWALQRVCNVVGDKSAGKTLLAMEASANFLMTQPKGARARYKECEAAFDPRYASSLGIPMERIDFGKRLDTVEDMFDDINDAIKAKVPTLEIIDSLDALSDTAELERDFGEGSYGTGKARDLSKLFRMLVRDMEKSELTLMIISQVRDKIGVAFGRKTRRAGGRALDFYASQVVYLQHVGTVHRTISGVRRATGLDIEAMIDKNKVGPPMRQAKFKLDFGYGVDDLETSLMWLKDVGCLKDVGTSVDGLKKYMASIRSINDEAEYRNQLKPIQEAVISRWAQIETEFMPKRRKYNGV